ncbi:methyltransferase domain-containing protein [Algoriphagus namhaensis]
MGFLDESYWSDRYTSGNTGWDIGFASPPLTQYLDQIQNKDLRILIPGAGNAHEASYALNSGFKHIYILDISEEPLKKFKSNYPHIPDEQLIRSDFFDFEGKFDLVLEQTFFCALDPKLRPDYVSKMKELINPNGKLVGVLFDRIFPFDGPPFGGTAEEYELLFRRNFSKGSISPCYNSIPERQGSEVWIEWQA